MTIFQRLSEEAGKPVSGRALETYLREHIVSGDLARGSKLPPVREAAWQLGCAPGTVSRAYQALTAQGLVHGVVGRGTFVGEGRPSYAKHFDLGDAPDMVDMAVNSFLMEPAGPMLREAMEAAAMRAATGTVRLDYVGPMGVPEDREAAMGLLSRWRQDLSVDGIALLNGAQAGFAAAFASLMSPGTTVAADQLTYPGVMTAAELTGRRVVAIGSDADGMLPDALDAACRAHAISMLILMPSVHNPTGSFMPAARRKALAEIAERHDLIILEDEVYGFLRAPIEESFSNLLPRRTILLTSLSKSVAPALRIGYAAGPPHLVRRMATAQNAMLLLVSPLLSATASHLLRGDALEARFEAIRKRLGIRARLLAEKFDVLDEDTMSGGLAWLPLPDTWRVDAFCAEAEALGVRLGNGHVFAAEANSNPNAVRLSFCAVAGDERFKDGIERLAELYHSPMPGGATAP